MAALCPPFGEVAPSTVIPGGKAEMKTWSQVILINLALTAVGLRVWLDPWPAPGEVALLDLIHATDPLMYSVFAAVHIVTPGLAVVLAGLLARSIWQIWLARWLQIEKAPPIGRLPSWPTTPQDDSPSLVIGEVHHPIEPREAAWPEWLVIPERGLYTGISIFGAVGSGKTSACMHPFAEQILSWAADDPRRRAAALVLEVKGDFCYSVREILQDAGRGGDYLEIGLGGSWQWNPLDDPDFDSYSLAYTVSTLLNQLFGKSKEPFWQQAYTNLVRWTIELHRIMPGGWVTLRDIYRCAIDPDLLSDKIEQARAHAESACPSEVRISTDHYAQHMGELDPMGAWRFSPRQAAAAWTQQLQDKLMELGIDSELEPGRGPGQELGERLDAVELWYSKDWRNLDVKLRTSIVEGVSVFLSLFDQPDVADIFCPPPPANGLPAGDHTVLPKGEPLPPPLPGLKRRLPPMADLIEQGKVLALNMPAGTNPALARAIGVMLKQAWLQALLRRPPLMARHPNRYFRPAAFICDEYQAFATVGQDDPAGDEQAFARTRQSRCIPIVATQSISSLRSVVHGGEAWRTLLQTLRTRIFLSLSDDASAKIASDMCGQVPRMKPNFSITETIDRGGVSLLTGRPGGGGRTQLGTTKGFRESREAAFHPRDFTLLSNYQAICLPYDGQQSAAPLRVYLKPHYLPRDRSYWRLREEGRI